MEPLAEMLLLVTTLGLVVYMLADYMAGKSELLTVRNVAILGFIVFQTLSGLIWLREDNYQIKYNLADPGGTAMKYAFACLLFAVIALWAYRSFPGTTLLARVTPASRIAPSTGVMIIFALVALGTAAVMRFGVNLPYVSVLASILGICLCGFAAGLAGWLMARNLLNPIMLVVAGTVLLIAVGIAMTGTYGRRTLVTVALGFAWGMYYSKLRHNNPAVTLTLLSIAVLPIAMFAAAFTSIRGGSTRRGSFFEIAQATLSGGSIREGLRDLDGQGTGGVSMWLMEVIGPEGLSDTSPLATFLYFFWYPVPRALFPEGKPNPLTMQIPDIANLQNVAEGLNIGPGVIGHAFADGGWLVVIFYALVAGVALRSFDEIASRAKAAPFVALPIGASLGELLGVARGETGYMAWQFVFGTAATFGVILIVGKTLEAFGYARLAEDTDSPSSGHDDGSYGYGNPYDDGYGYDDSGGYEYDESVPADSYSEADGTR